MATKILDFLWLGNQWDAEKALADNMKKGQVWEIVNVLESPETEFNYNIPILYQDSMKRWQVNWSKVMEATDLIERLSHTSKSKVLLHCGAGQERSPLVCQYYLIRYLDMGADAAFNFIKAKRPEIMRCDKNYKW